MPEATITLSRGVYENLLAEKNESENEKSKLLEITTGLKLENSRLREENKTLESDLYLSRTELKQLKRMMFGVKRERYIPENPAQLRFNAIGDVEENDVLAETPIPAHTRKSRKKRAHPGRVKIPDHLPRETTVMEPPEINDQNRHEYEKIGEEVSEQLETTPMRLTVSRTVRPKYKRKADGKILCAHRPETAFAKYKVAPSTISTIITHKYNYHLPLNRLRQMYQNQGVRFTEASMVNGIASACEKLIPFYNFIFQKIETALYIQADETTYKVIEKGKGSAHQGYMYFYCIEKKYVFVNYQRGRGRDGPRLILEGFQGTLTTDGYEGYNEAVRENGIVHVACMAHIRRKFFEACEAGEKQAEPALKLIQELYEIESEIKGLANLERKNIRKNKAKPLLKKLFEWVSAEIPKNLPNSPTRKACKYFLGQYERMERYLEHPEADIDNNFAENNIRPLTIGRKNYLFAGSENGANRAAILYTLVLTCRIHGVDPYRYFIRVFDLINSGANIHLEDLMPDKIRLE